MTFLMIYVGIALFAIVVCGALYDDEKHSHDTAGYMLVGSMLWPLLLAWMIGTVIGDWLRK